MGQKENTEKVCSVTQAPVTHKWVSDRCDAQCVDKTHNRHQDGELLQI